MFAAIARSTARVTPRTAASVASVASAASVGASRAAATGAVVAARAASSTASSTGGAAASFASRAAVVGSISAAVVAAAATTYVATSTPSLSAATMPLEGIPGTRHERTFLMCKPDAVQRGLVGEIIARWEKRGYKLCAIKVVQPDKKLASAHYADLSGRPFFAGLVDYMSSSGPVVAMVWEGENVILASRNMLGVTDPQKSPAGTVRGDFALNIGRNILHGSDGSEGAKSEINLWFKAGEVQTYGRVDEGWLYEQ